MYSSFWRLFLYCKYFNYINDLYLILYVRIKVCLKGVMSFLGESAVGCHDSGIRDISYASIKKSTFIYRRDHVIDKRHWR